MRLRVSGRPIDRLRRGADWVRFQATTGDVLWLRPWRLGKCTSGCRSAGVRTAAADCASGTAGKWTLAIGSGVLSLTAKLGVERVLPGGLMVINHAASTNEMFVLRNGTAPARSPLLAVVTVDLSGR